MIKTRHSPEHYKEGILNGDRIVLAKAITLVESTLQADIDLANQLIDSILGATGNSIRIGITGVPGVGKSTFIEAFGQHLISEDKKIAILSVDPTSPITKGSILGDKTRMEELSRNPKAFIRPTASGEVLGGVALKTREVILLCEAAGFDVILVETVGVGQSEAAVKNLTDFFLLLMLAGAGDELQGIKKGIMEMADTVVITKADGDNMATASKAAAAYQQALHLQQVRPSGWNPKLLTCSAVTKKGIPEVWKIVRDYVEKTKASGHFQANRNEQDLVAFQEYFRHLLQTDFLKSENLKQAKNDLEKKIRSTAISAHNAALQLLKSYRDEIRKEQD